MARLIDIIFIAVILFESHEAFYAMGRRQLSCRKWLASRTWSAQNPSLFTIFYDWSSGDFFISDLWKNPLRRAKDTRDASGIRRVAISRYTSPQPMRYFCIGDKCPSTFASDWFKFRDRVSCAKLISNIKLCPPRFVFLHFFFQRNLISPFLRWK